MPALDLILPAVLAGGKSRRFGRDKLKEPLPPSPAGGTRSGSSAPEPGWVWPEQPPTPHILIDVPIRALRDVFGPRIALVGPCDPALRSRADAHVEDLFPGAGPLGGIASALAAALERRLEGVFILAGDLPGITPDTIRAILAAAANAPAAPAIIASTDRPQPCIALYLAPALDALRQAAAHGRPLVETVQDLGAATVPIDPRSAANVNAPTDLLAFRAGS